MGVSSGSKSSWKKVFPVATEGFGLIAASSFVTIYLGTLSFNVMAVFFGVVTLFLSFFFRDPERVIPDEEGALVSPADGKIVEVKVVQHSEFSAEKRLKVSIFMSIFDVHVNRVPMDGTVTDISYHPGRFFSANLDKASEDNERNMVTFEASDGAKIVVVQVAGLVARRIICRIYRGDHLRRGERFGMICFGSRLDVYFPPDTQTVVSVGDKVFAGTSVLGHLT